MAIMYTHPSECQKREVYQAYSDNNIAILWNI